MVRRFWRWLMFLDYGDAKAEASERAVMMTLLGG